MVKKALVVGVDYVGQSCGLSGCASDAYAWAEYLDGQGYEVTLLVDDSKPDVEDRQVWASKHGPPHSDPPTRAAILRHLVGLVTSEATEVMFTFSGHGSQMADGTHEEADGKDEVLCPVDMRDHRTGGVITDDALRGVWQSLRPSQQARAVHDCCHSGTGMDLPYQLYDRGGTGFRFIREGGEETPAHVLLLAGCQDSQTSAESGSYNSATGQHESRGALSVATIQTLKERNGRVGAAQLLGDVRAKLKNRRMTQIAQLSSGRDVSPWISFLP